MFSVRSLCQTVSEIILLIRYNPRLLATFTECSIKTDTQFYFWDNFGNSAPTLTILSLLQAEIYGA